MAGLAHFHHFPFFLPLAWGKKRKAHARICYRRECEPIVQMLKHGGPCCDMRIYASLGGGLYWFVFSPFCLGRCDSSLFIFKFPFVENKVSHVFNDVLVYFFHECFNACLWDFKVG